MKKHENIQEIINYLEGDLSEQDMEELEVRALLNPSFQKDIKTTRILIKGITESGKLTTKAEKIQQLQNHPIDQLDTEKKQDNNKEAKVVWLHRYRKKFFHPLAIASSLAILIIATVFFPSSQTPQQIFTTNFTLSPNIGLTAMRSVDKQPPTKTAYQAYDNKNFAEAAVLFEQNIPGSDRRITDLFHLGNCYLEMEEWDKAITALEEVVNAQTSRSENAKWFLSLAYLPVGEIEKAKQLLKEIKDPARTKQVRKILKKLN